MVVILLIGLLASFLFRNAAQKKGYSSPKIWILPLALTGIILIATLVISLLGGAFMGSDTAKSLQGFVSTILGLIIQSVVLIKMWKQLKQLPSRK